MDKILLISPRLPLKKTDFIGSGIPYWPLELATLAAHLHHDGYQVQVLDLFGMAPQSFSDMDGSYWQGCPIETAFRLHPPGEPDLVVLYAISYMSHSELIRIIEFLRKNIPSSKIVLLENAQAVTGYSLLACRDDYFKAGAQALLLGDAYWNWESIYRFVRRKEGKCPENLVIPGDLTSREPQRLYQKNYQTLPPRWELFPYRNYWRLPYSHGPAVKPYFPLFTSRGCPFSCDFCAVPETNSQKWRGRSAKDVVDEMLYLRDRFSVRHFQIEDLNPIVDNRRWEDICRLLIAKQAGIYFYFVSGTKVETISLDQLEMMAEAGCRYISISPETGSPRLLKKMNKSFDHDHGLEVVERCRRLGIAVQACFLVGHPDETDEDHRDSLHYLKELTRRGLEEVAVFAVAPVYGSRIYQRQGMKSQGNLSFLSFGVESRDDTEVLKKRRRELTLVFLKERALLWPGWLGPAWRSLIGTPRTKLENLPRRIAYLKWHTMFC